MTLLDFVRLTRHNLALILACIGLGGLVATGYAATRPVVYQSTATGVVIAGDPTSIGSAMSGNGLATQRASSYVALIGSKGVWERVAKDPEIVAHPGSTNGGLTAAVFGTAGMIRVTATGTSGENAQLLADAGLKALSEEALRLETLNPTDSGTAVQPAQVVVRLVVFSSAFASSSPISPNWSRLIATGLGAGLVLGYAIAFLRRQLDVRVRTIGDMEQLTGAGVLGIIPDTKELGRQRERGAEPIIDMGRAGEALRQLRTNLRYVHVDEPPRTIVVTSANPGEGKSTISSNLARLIARSGESVVLIDADLRKPVQHTLFGSDGTIGLTQVLAGAVSVEDVIVNTDERNLRFIPAGRIPPNPSEILGSKRMRDLIAKLAKDHVVILDGPPMLAVTDAGLLSTATDGVILVARVGKTYKDQVRHCVKLLNQIGGTLLGSVLHRAPRRAMGDVVYGAGYGGGYQSYYGDYYREDSSAEPAPAPATAPESAPEAPASSSDAGSARRAL